MRKSLLALVVLGFTSSIAFAQSQAPAPAASTGANMAPSKKAAEAPRTAASLECSKEADGKSLHGKERKKFMSSCKKEAKAKAN